MYIYSIKIRKAIGSISVKTLAYMTFPNVEAEQLNGKASINTLYICPYSPAPVSPTFSCRFCLDWVKLV